MLSQGIHAHVHTTFASRRKSTHDHHQHSNYKLLSFLRKSFASTPLSFGGASPIFVISAKPCKCHRTAPSPLGSPLRLSLHPRPRIIRGTRRGDVKLVVNKFSIKPFNENFPTPSPTLPTHLRQKSQSAFFVALPGAWIYRCIRGFRDLEVRRGHFGRNFYNFWNLVAELRFFRIGSSNRRKFFEMTNIITIGSSRHLIFVIF